MGRLTVPLSLQVSPVSNIIASGFQGGSFGPQSFTYQISASIGSVDFSISGFPNWLTASLTSGTATTMPITVTFSVNATANTLLPGVYGPTLVTLTNTTNGQGTQTRTATLIVLRSVATHDFNGDGYSDILWQDTSGDTSAWLMIGAQVLSSAGIGNIPTTWSVVGQRDFNGDGRSDILWRDTLGNTAIWFMNGTQVQSSASVGNIPTTWTVAGTGDFNGDGFGDLLWRDTSGNLAIWETNGAQLSSSAEVGLIPNYWSIVGVGDFNRDEMSDILWRDTLGNTAIWFMNGTQVQSSASVAGAKFKPLPVA
jgi:FG-GAP-like repeat